MKRFSTFFLALLIMSMGVWTANRAMADTTAEYQELAKYLDNGDYNGAIEYIVKLKSQNTNGTLEDYLIEVEIDEDNFDEYFEVGLHHPKDEFGEEDQCAVQLGLISKKYYEDDLVIYSMDDIAIEYYIGEDFDMLHKDYLDNYLTWGMDFSRVLL